MKKKYIFDILAAFIEILNCVENSGVVVYRRDKSFKMASKSEELLAGDGIEEILKVIDSDILAETNSLESLNEYFPYRVCIYNLQKTGY